MEGERHEERERSERNFVKDEQEQAYREAQMLDEVIINSINSISLLLFTMRYPMIREGKLIKPYTKYR